MRSLESYLTCSFFPLKGYAAINIFGLIIFRKDYYKNFLVTHGERLAVILNHEEIHTAQMKEMLFIPFYLWYVIEYVIKVCWYRSFTFAYRNISFEREAYENEHTASYLHDRKPYAWLKCIKSSKYNFHPPSESK